MYRDETCRNVRRCQAEHVRLGMQTRSPCCVHNASAERSTLDHGSRVRSLAACRDPLSSSSLSFRNCSRSRRPWNLDRKLCKSQGSNGSLRAANEIFILGLSRASLKQDLKRPTALLRSRDNTKIARAGGNRNRIRSSTIKTTRGGSGDPWPMEIERCYNISISTSGFKPLGAAESDPLSRNDLRFSAGRISFLALVCACHLRSDDSSEGRRVKVTVSEIQSCNFSWHSSFSLNFLDKITEDAEARGVLIFLNAPPRLIFLSVAYC